MHHKKKKISAKKIAEERIVQLFSFADKLFKSKEFISIPDSEKQKLADRYVVLARKIAMKCNYTIPQELKQKFCKHCHKYFRHGINIRVRINQGKIIKYCLTCKKFSRFPLNERKSEKESERKTKAREKTKE